MPIPRSILIGVSVLMLTGIVQGSKAIPANNRAYVEKVMLDDYPDEQDLMHAIHYYQKQNFTAALRKLEKYLSTTKDRHCQNYLEARHYLLLCYLELGKSGAESRIKTFVEDYPNSVWAIRLEAALGSTLYQKQAYRKAIPYLKKSFTSSPRNAREQDANFKLAYSYLAIGREREAVRVFKSLSSRKNDYYGESNYYIGALSYELGEFQTAISYLNQSKQDQRFVREANLLLGQSYYELSLCEDLSDFLNQIEREEHDVNLFYYGGDCAYRKQNYEAAYEWLTRYKLNSTNFEDAIAIQYLHASYEVGLFDEQLASREWSPEYQPRVLNIEAKANERNGNFMKAAIIYEQIALLQPDKKEEATFAKINALYSANQYDGLASLIEDYQNEFPQGKYKRQLQSIGTNVILQTEGGLAASRYVKKNKIKSVDSKSFIKEGIKDAFTRQNYEEVYQLLNEFEAELLSREVDFYHYYLGIALAEREEIAKAISSYKKVNFNSDYYLLAQYQAGIWLYNQSQGRQELRAEVQSIFESLLKKQNLGTIGEAKVTDIYARLGNLYAIDKQYERANHLFKVALQKGADPAFVLYSVGQIYYAQGDYDKANKEFDKVIRGSTSPYQETALYRQVHLFSSPNKEKGKMYKFRKAINKANDFVRAYPNSDLMPDILLMRADTWDKLAQKDRALNDYKAVIENYPNSEASKNAIFALRTMDRASLSKYPELIAYLDGYKKTNSSKQYERSDAIARRYANEANKRNRKIFKDALSAYENGQTAEAARLYVKGVYEDGELLYKNKEYVKSAARFRSLLELEEAIGTPYYDRSNYYIGLNYLLKSSPDTTMALDYLSRVEGEVQDFALYAKGEVELNREYFLAAMNTYEKLLKVTNAPERRAKALEQLVVVHYELGDKKRVKDYIELLESDNYATSGFADLYKYKLTSLERKEEALDGFTRLSEGQVSEKVSWNAKYEMAKILYELGDKKSASSILLEISRNYRADRKLSKKVRDLQALLY